MKAYGHFAWSALSAAAFACALTTGAMAQGKNKPPTPPVLKEAGTFFVNAETTMSNYPTIAGAPGRIVRNKMYVEYMIPKNLKKNAYPIIMEHGSWHTGATYGTTPDGREGWANYFARKGYPVYVVDQVGRGRSGFDASLYNQATAQQNAALLPAAGLAQSSYENAWSVFRFGPAVDQWYPNSQFPREAIDHYMAQLVPNTESTLPDRNIANVNALEALLEKIGPAVVMVHSQSGGDGLGIATRRPDLVKAYIDVEGRSGCTPMTSQQVQTLTKVPFLTVIGDFNYPNEQVCREAVQAVNAAGGDATHGLLPDFGFHGNSHMLMMDRNNLKIADWIQKWLEKKVESKNKPVPKGRVR